MKYEVTIGSKKYTIDDADLAVGKIGEDMDRAAAQIAFFASLWSQAEEEQENADAAYRAWRAELGRTILEADPKTPEWKVKQEIEGSDKFLTYKKAIAATFRNTTFLRGLYEAAKSKASILQSKGAMQRAEMEATGMTTRSTRGAYDDEPERSRADKKEALRERNLKKRSGE